MRRTTNTRHATEQNPTHSHHNHPPHRYLNFLQNSESQRSSLIFNSSSRVFPPFPILPLPLLGLGLWTMSLRPNARTEVRRNRYKVAVDADEGRRRREDNMVEIRKSKREESLQKKRREGLQAQQPFPTPLQSSSIVEKKVLLFALEIRVTLWSSNLGFRWFGNWNRDLRLYRLKRLNCIAFGCDWGFGMLGCAVVS